MSNSQFAGKHVLIGFQNTSTKINPVPGRLIDGKYPFSHITYFRLYKVLCFKIIQNMFVLFHI